MTLEKVTRVAALISIINGCLFLLLNPLRLAFVADVFTPFLYINLGVMLLCCGVCFCNINLLKFKRIEVILFLLLICVTVSTDYTGRQFFDVVVDFFRPFLFIVTIIFFRNFGSAEKLCESANLASWVKISIWVTVIAVIFCWVINIYIFPLYIAYSSIDSILGLGWLLSTGSVFSQIFYIFVLIFSGKRGVYLAGLLVLFICYKKSLFSLSFKKIMFFLFLMPMFLYLNVDIISALFLKIEYHRVESIDPYYVLNILSGGRIEEIQGAIAAIKSPTAYIFGEGLGFAYVVDVFKEDGQFHRNLHFTPGSLAIYYGLPFALTFFYYLSGFFIKAMQLIRYKSPPLIYSYAIYCIASMFFLLTEFSVFAYANFAISCGIVGCASRQYAVVNKAKERP